jgi:hypothetical protein
MRSIAEGGDDAEVAARHRRDCLYPLTSLAVGDFVTGTLRDTERGPALTGCDAGFGIDQSAAMTRIVPSDPDGVVGGNADDEPTVINKRLASVVLLAAARDFRLWHQALSPRRGTVFGRAGLTGERGLQS